MKKKKNSEFKIGEVVVYPHGLGKFKYRAMEFSIKQIFVVRQPKLTIVPDKQEVI